MALTPDVIADAPILSTWGNEIRNRTVQNFATAAERSTQWTAPPEGAVSFLRDTNAFQVFDGTSWVWLGGALTGSWTPLWQGPGSNATGVTTRGRYHRTGNLVHLTAYMQHGVGSNTGTQLQVGGLPWRLSCPGTYTHGHGHFWRSSPAGRWPLHALGGDTDTYVLLQGSFAFAAPGFVAMQDAGSGSGGTPFPWANGCEANLSLTYHTDQ